MQGRVFIFGLRHRRGDRRSEGAGRTQAVLALVWMLGLVCMCLLGGSAAARGEQRPNVLWIVSDDHAPYVCSAYGNRQVRTPNIDRLASEGMRLDRAYCNSPVCTASRQSFLTGRYPRTVGVTQLLTPLPESEVTLAEMLAAAGYQTVALGKMHFNSRLLHGFDKHLDKAAYHKFLQARGGPRPVPNEIAVLPKKWRPFRDPAEVWLNGSYLPLALWDADMLSTYLAEEADRFLATAGTQRPFFLVVSFRQPHSPFHFPIEYRNRLDPRGFDVPEVGPEDDWQIPAIFRHLTREQKQGIIASYYTATEYLDAKIGQVLDALDRSPHRDNTLVVYVGDHGYMLGQHGRFEKHCMYEQAVRSPLLFRLPGRIAPGRASDAMVELIDIVPTVLEFCGIDIPERVQGRSLVPVLRGQTTRHRDHVIVEYSENEEAMIRTPRWKLIYTTGNRRRQDGYETGRDVPDEQKVRLYDLENDPEEFHNLANEPRQAERVERLLSELAQHMVRTARLPEHVPPSDVTDPRAILDFCLVPRDVKRPTPTK